MQTRSPRRTPRPNKAWERRFTRSCEFGIIQPHIAIDDGCFVGVDLNSSAKEIINEKRDLHGYPPDVQSLFGAFDSSPTNSDRGEGIGASDPVG